MSEVLDTYLPTVTASTDQKIQLRYLHQVYYTPARLFRMHKRDFAISASGVRALLYIWCGNARKYDPCGPRLQNLLEEKAGCSKSHLLGSVKAAE